MQLAFDLGAYAEVKANAEGMYERLARRLDACDGAWPEEQIALFRRWIDEGFPN